MMLAPLLLSIYTISFATAAIVPLIDPLSDSQFSTNSMHAHDSCEPWDAKYTVSHEHDGWCVASTTNLGAPNGPYLEINFGRKTNIHAIATKGRACCTQYVTSYILSYYDGNTWIQYDSGFVFVGNNGNYQEEVRHELINYNGLLVAAQYIRFYPITYVGTAAMRVEAYGNDWTASPTNNPTETTQSPGTQSPTETTNIPTMNPSISPTKSPTFNPIINPTQSPTITTNIPTINPSKSPTKNPSNYPSKLPSYFPTNIPSISPTQYPTQVTYSPTLNTLFPTNIPSGNPTQNPTISSLTPTQNPTNNPTKIDRGGEVQNETTEIDNDKENGLKVHDGDKLPLWVYILAVCSGILCCLGVILIGYKMKVENKRKVSDGDAFRMQANTELDGDVWTNPVHHQMDRLASTSYGKNEGNVLTTMNTDDVSTQESNTQENYNDDRTPTTIEMGDMNANRTREGSDEFEVNNEVLTPNGYQNEDEDDIDNINNAPNGGDEEMIGDIDNIVTKGVTNMGDDIDDDIDAIDNNINDEIINDIDHMITHGGDNCTQEGDDDDVVDDNLQHEMETPGGDNDIDNMNINEYDEDNDEDINNNFPYTMQ